MRSASGNQTARTFTEAHLRLTLMLAMYAPPDVFPWHAARQLSDDEL